jgi:phospholipid/cholesterol/gamma-HCH transport system substrate-binding protein
MALYQVGRQVDHVRHTNEWVGLMVVLATLLFGGAMLEAGLLRDWFRPVSHLRILLPQSGVGGLAVGADIDVLGIHAGKVTRVVLNPNQIYAEADIDKQAEAFIRRDSNAVIRRSFGIVGAAYVDITRGAGPPMNWSYAVIEATTEQSPTDTISSIISELRQKIIPVLDNAKRTMDSLAVVADNLKEGRGTMGRLLTDDTLVRQTEETVHALQDQITALAPFVAQIADAAKRTDALVQNEIGPVLGDARRAMESVTALANSLEEGRGTLGRLLTDDTLSRKAERTVQVFQDQLVALGPLVSRLDDVAGGADALVRRDLPPLLDDAKRAMDSVAAITDSLSKGRGTLGLLMTDDTLFRRSEQSLQTLQDDLATLAPVVARLDEAARQVDLLVQSAGSGKEGAPSLVQRADTLLQNLQSASRDVSKATPYLPQIAKNIAGGSANLPALLTQVQVAAADLQRLIIQLRGSWLFGGGGSQPAETRLPPFRVQP